ncbi:MAG: dephospho-CoA kinase [Deltaproteobacteria bacterium]|nr:dephospho-CoA kinase [Deltaproteobacteria bacterium]
MGASITHVIGLTGGIACGKSTVAEHFRARGVRIIDADQIAREVVAPGEPALAALVRAFGDAILAPDGTLDRQALGALAFSDPARLKTLNAITHPAILARTGKLLAEAQRDKLGWVLYEAALILENKAQHGLSALVCVLCPRDLQRERLLARSGLTEDEADRRIAAQTDDATRREFATWLIDNDGTRADLDARAAATYDAIVQRFGPHDRRLV